MLMCPGFIRDMLTDKDADRLDDRQIANNAAHGFGAAMYGNRQVRNCAYSKANRRQGHFCQYNTRFHKGIVIQLLEVPTRI